MGGQCELSPELDLGCESGTFRRCGFEAVDTGREIGGVEADRQVTVCVRRRFEWLT